jgi:DNA-binding NtrC family response regulator
MASRERVLVVDDDESIRVTTGALLEDDFEVVTAASGREALALIATAPPFDAVCSDYRMAGMTGDELLRQCNSLAMPIAGVLVSAYCEQVDRRSDDNFFRVMKPYEEEDLIRAVRLAVQTTKLRRVSKAVGNLATRKESDAKGDTPVGKGPAAANAAAAAKGLATAKGSAAAKGPSVPPLTRPRPLSGK